MDPASFAAVDAGVVDVHDIYARCGCPSPRLTRPDSDPVLLAASPWGRRRLEGPMPDPSCVTRGLGRSAPVHPILSQPSTHGARRGGTSFRMRAAHERCRVTG